MLNKILNFAIPSIPQVLGFFTFFIILKGYIGYDNLITERLPIYQMAVGFSAVILLGISYSKLLFTISFLSLIKLIGVIFIICFGFFYNDNSLTFSLIIANLCIQVFLNIKILNTYNKNIYVFYLTIYSFLLPQLLWVNIPSLILILLFQLGFYNLLSIKKKNDGDFQGLLSKDVFLSIFMQAPLMITSFFDPLLIEAIGKDTYKQYILILKITNGIALFCFAKIQLEILYGEIEQKNLKKWKFYIWLVLSLILCISFLKIKYGFFFQILFYSVLVNIISLVVRYNLKNNNNNLLLLIKPFISILIYYSFLKLPLDKIIFQNFFISVISFSFIFLMVPNISYILNKNFKLNKK